MKLIFGRLENSRSCVDRDAVSGYYSLESKICPGGELICHFWVRL